MITISKHTEIVAVNVFRVEPEQQQHVIDFLVENRHRSMKHPGCLSVGIHKGLDGIGSLIMSSGVAGKNLKLLEPTQSLLLAGSKRRN